MDLFVIKNRLLLSLLVTCCSVGPAVAEVVLEEVSQEVTAEITGGGVAVPVVSAGQVELESVSDMDEAKNPSVVFVSLEQMDELVQLGLPSLALSLLSQEQKKWPVYSPDWYAFERKHISLLSTLEDWQAVIDRTRLLLKEAEPGRQITRQIAHWFQTQQVIAQLRLGQAEQALIQLRGLLWHSDKPETGTLSEPVSSDLVALWRRLVIRAYLAMNVDIDAQKSLLRYQVDYSSNHQNLNLDWRLLRARSLLRTDRAADVITLLADTDSHIAQAIRLIAALRTRPESAVLYAQEMQMRIADTKLNRGELWAYQYVLYQAYLTQKKLIDASRVLRELIIQVDAHAMLGEEFVVGGDDLWRLYESIGKQLGNSAKLLLGDDLAWYNKASELQKNNIVEALSLYVVLAFNATDVTKRQMAHREIVVLLTKDKNGLELVNQLYLHGNRISTLESLPLAVRYSLVDYALTKGDMELVVRLMKSVQQPPDGQDEFAWAMRKARVLIMEGVYDEGEAVLASTLNAAQQITPDQLDQFLQVIFDLQTVRRHQQVLVLLDSLRPEWLNENIERELFFWRAESYASLNQYDRSAWLYLKSAQLADQAEAGLWAQSARFKAAGALVKAALYDDAQAIYKMLLQVTTSESRKSVIRQELQQIRLLRNSEKS
ncbi:MAG: hypothetical protein OEZ15_05275 [Gammaproteobacteria bacterium]|nr:hypothetical protein [Gammaproteobacteria bacterium]